MKIILSSTLLLFSHLLSAQTIEQGKKFMSYERYQSANKEFTNVLNQKPADPEATYWLGQSLIGMGDIDKAKNLYRTAIKDNNHPLLLVGCGEADLLENKTAEAKNRFESAITMTKSKNPEVLAAIARANINAPVGDRSYAITQMEAATALKGVKNPELFVLKGDAYEKKDRGDSAIRSYEEALSLDSNNVLAVHRLAFIYFRANIKQQFVPLYEKAIEKDPAFAPAYFSLYEYWFKRDVNKAETYLKQFINKTDQDPQNAYHMINLKGASKQYAEAIKDADALIQQIGPDNVKPRIYRLKASCFKDLGDIPSALKSADEFFKRVKQNDILSQDYELYADILALTEGQQSNAFSYYEKALTIETVTERMSALMAKGYDLAKKQNNKPAIVSWQSRLFVSKQNPSSVDFFNLGKAYYDAGLVESSYFLKGDSVFSNYAVSFPAQPFPHYWKGRYNQAIDSNMVTSNAYVHYERFEQMAIRSADSTSFRSQLKITYYYLLQHSFLVAKDYKKANYYCNRLLSIDPADKLGLDYQKKLVGKSLPMPEAFIRQIKGRSGLINNS